MGQSPATRDLSHHQISPIEEGIVETTNKLMHGLSAAEANTSRIESDVKALDSELQKIDTDLQASKRVNDSLHTLDDALTTASDLLDIVKIIPSICQGASTLKKTIDAYHVPITKAVKTSDAVEKVVKPIRDKIEEYEPKVAKADTVLLDTMNAENRLIDIVGSAQHCINSLPDSALKSKLDGALDTCSGKFDPIVTKIDAMQKIVLTNIEDAKTKADEIETWARNLIDLNVQISRVIDILSPLIDSLRAIADAFKQTIRVPCGGYPKICKKWGVPYVCGWHTVYFSFTIEQILNGINGVIKPVMDLLNEAMYAILNPLLKKLNLSITLPAIPGLDVLDAILNQLPNVFNSIIATLDMLLGKLNDFSGFVQEIKNILDAIGAINTECQVNIQGTR
jgi:hypothetical protein